VRRPPLPRIVSFQAGAHSVAFAPVGDGPGADGDLAGSNDHRDCVESEPPVGRTGTADAIRRIFDRVLRELADVDDPMRSLVSIAGLGDTLREGSGQQVNGPPDRAIDADDRMAPGPPELVPPATDPSPARTGLTGLTRNGPRRSPTSHRIRNPANAVPGSTPTKASSSSTTGTPTTCSSRMTKRPCSTTSPRLSPRSTCCSTAHAPAPMT
jgi:hypothetical protein